MSAECNACYTASTTPLWIAQVVTRNRIDHPCERHANVSQHPQGRPGEPIGTKTGVDGGVHISERQAGAQGVTDESVSDG